MMKVSIIIPLLLIVCVSVVIGHRHYQQVIPNGDHFNGWPGLGHQDPHGSGALNPFGVDFAASNHTWTVSLCQKDSDKDGFTNGQELGDPDCIWKEGDVPTRTTDLSHPGYPGNPQGIVDECTNAVDREGRVDAVWQMNGFVIPSEQTNYWCQKFLIPEGYDDLYLYRIDHIIDSDLLHHTIIYECNNDMEGGGNSPFSCMDTPDCQFVVGWAPGTERQCYDEELGRKFSKDKTYYIQYHYNNPQHLEGEIDYSGSSLRFTTIEPTHLIDTLEIGTASPVLIDIPPGEISVLSNACPSVCTKYILPLNGVTVQSSLLHAHYRATDLWLQQTHGGITRNVTMESPYNYDNQRYRNFDSPLILHQGDSIEMFCRYDTTSDTEHIHGGLGSDDEMCFAFLTYFPIIEQKFCGLVQTDGFHDGTPFYYCGKLFDSVSMRELSFCDDEAKATAVSKIQHVLDKCVDGCDSVCHHDVDTWVNQDCVYSEGVNLFLARNSDEKLSSQMRDVIDSCIDYSTGTHDDENQSAPHEVEPAIIIVAIVVVVVIFSLFLVSLFKVIKKKKPVAEF